MFQLMMSQVCYFWKRAKTSLCLKTICKLPFIYLVYNISVLFLVFINLITLAENFYNNKAKQMFGHLCKCLLQCSANDKNQNRSKLLGNLEPTGLSLFEQVPIFCWECPTVSVQGIPCLTDKHSFF